MMIQVNNLTPREKAIGIGSLVVGAAVLVAGIVFAMGMGPIGTPGTAEEAIETIASDRFKALPEYRKQEYLKKANLLVRELPEEQRRKLFDRSRTDDKTRSALREVRRNEMTERVLAFARAAPQERERILDEFIMEGEARRQQRMAEMQKRREEAAKNGDAEPTRNRREMSDEERAERRQKMQEHIKERFQEGNPQMGALMMEFFRAMRERREALGLSGGRGGRGGGRGGAGGGADRGGPPPPPGGGR